MDPMMYMIHKHTQFRNLKILTLNDLTTSILNKT